jgi:MFS family permease
MNNSPQGSAAEPSKLYRWMLLLLVSISIGASYYVFDSISTLKSILQLQLNISSGDYGTIVAFYAFPNLILVLIGGIIVDKFGIKKTGTAFLTFCVIGTFLTAYGASESFTAGGSIHSFFNSFLTDYSAEFKMMCLGRLIFGLGAETSIVVINKIIVKWFKGKELATAFAINVTIARVGTLAAFFFSESFATDTSVGMAIWFATILMVVGLISFLIYAMMDKKQEAVVKTAEDEFHLSDIVDLITNKSFVYIVLLCVTFYSAVFPFQSYCPDLLQNKFMVSREWSGYLTGFISFGTILFTPLAGLAVDKYGKRATMMIYGSGLLVLVHTSLGLTGLTPYFAIFFLGVAFSLVPAAMWPSVALIVEEKKIGTAFGLMTAIQNMGLFLFPIFAGYMLDITNSGVSPQMVADGVAHYDYTYTMLMFAGLGLLGLLFAFLLKREDDKEGSYGLDKAQ